MKELAILITEMVNQFHDAFISLCGIFGIHLTDKEMHFWVIGIFGIFFFGVTHAVFTWLSKWSMTPCPLSILLQSSLSSYLRLRFSKR